MASGTEANLKKLVWKKIQDTIIKDTKDEGDWKILILDHFTTKLLSSCCKMTDLMHESITIVEDLYKNREPVEDMKAIYFITPTEKSVDALVNDFKKKFKYKAAYVYFTDYCPNSLFNNLKTYCAKYIRVCKEINVAFLPYESQVFTLDYPDAFHSIYSIYGMDKNTTLQNIASQLATFCACLDENPGVRYRREPLDNAKHLAQLVDEKLAEHYEIDDNNKGKGKTNTQLLIIDRGFDPVSVILHELTYQAMVYDVIPIENDTYKYKTKDGASGKEKQCILNEDDELWVKLRHMHIAEVSAHIPKLVKEISANKKATDGKHNTIGALSQLMKKMPAFRKQMAKQTIHVSLAEDCMAEFQKKVEKLCKVEQDLAVGADVEGQKVKDPMRTLLPVLLQNYSTYDKIRAVLLYIFSLNGTTEENLNKLIQHIKIEDESKIILNWKELGVPILSSLNYQTRKTQRRDRSQEETYQLSRWTPVIKDIMEDATENKLDSKEWPHQSECPAAYNGSGAVSARQKYNKPSSTDDRRSGSRLIVFVIGGISYSEMRCAYEVSQASKSFKIYIGSTHIITPKHILDDMQSLSKSKVPMDTFEVYEEESKV
ncbi:syntaxin-binding protein 3 [Polypterus senegalus]|nr:syntaxin-binding protein 3 [Polypterus senegalus]